jgi:hypothetical protein
VIIDVLIVGDEMGNVYTVEKTFFNTLKSNLEKVEKDNLPMFSLLTNPFAAGKSSVKEEKPVEKK